MIFRIKFNIKGVHVHCSLYVLPSPNETGAYCGTFIVRKGGEFKQLLRVMSGIQFILSDNHDNQGMQEAINESMLNQKAIDEARREPNYRIKE